MISCQSFVHTQNFRARPCPCLTFLKIGIAGICASKIDCWTNYKLANYKKVEKIRHPFLFLTVFCEHREGEGCSSGSQEHITEKKECDKVEKGAKKEDSPSKYEKEKDGEGEAKEDGKTKEDGKAKEDGEAKEEGKANEEKDTKEKGETEEDGKTKEDVAKKDDKGKPTGDGGTEDKAGTKDADEKKDTKAKAETTDKDEKASNKTATTTAKPKKDYWRMIWLSS